MNVVVLAKYVPEPLGTPHLGPDHLLVRSGVDGALDPGDEFGLELGLRLVEAHGGEVTVVSMGPEEASAATQRALAMGADRAVLISDASLRGADALVTARVLAATLQRGTFDLVIAGVESTDGYTGTVPVTIAALLRIPNVTAVRKLELDENGFRIERQTDDGYDVLACPMPALVTVTAGATEPRYPSLKGIMAAKSKPTERPALADLGIEETTATQRVSTVTDAPPRSAGDIVSGDDAVGRIADLLSRVKAI
jgi:electron transfer flavoprotein beta subunit